MSGKGSKRRPCNEKKVAENWPFKKKVVKTWKRDKKGNLIE